MISHILLDIEGTTCPVSFVSDVLFPYATHNIKRFAEQHHNRQDIKNIFNQARDELSNDASLSAAEQTQWLNNKATDWQGICDYLIYLISIDRKSTALKDLQGKIWRQGYEEGEIKSHLYPEAGQCFQEWRLQRKALAVYSSGSIEAQKLLYQHTESGDLRPLFLHWFDTHTGPKKEAQSYSLICTSMNVAPESVLFISDSGAECDAARQAGLRTLFSLREGNPDLNPRSHQAITSLNAVTEYLNKKAESEE